MLKSRKLKQKTKTNHITQGKNTQETNNLSPEFRLLVLVVLMYLFYIMIISKVQNLNLKVSLEIIIRHLCIFRY